jgi:hypothetical protein
MEVTIFCNVAQLATFLVSLIFNPNDEGSTFLRNFRKFLPEYIALHLRL